MVEIKYLKRDSCEYFRDFRTTVALMHVLNCCMYLCCRTPVGSNPYLYSVD